MRSLNLNRHELYHAAALFRIAVLGFCKIGPIKNRKNGRFFKLENVVTSSTNPGFGGWFDDPMIRMIQVEGLKLQPCPTLFSESLAPSVSHLADENNDLCQLLASDPSLCSIFDAESLLRRVWGDQQMQQMKSERNSIEALCSSEGGIMGLQSLKFKRLTSKYTFSLFYLILLVISPFCQKKEQRGRCVSWLVISE